MSTRTVIKANYTTVKSAGSGAALQANMGESARYYGTRADELGQRQERYAFDSSRDDLGPDEVQDRLKSREPEYAYRMVVSPGRDLHGEHLRDWTRSVMLEIERAHRQRSSDRERREQVKRDQAQRDQGQRDQAQRDRDGRERGQRLELDRQRELARGSGRDRQQSAGSSRDQAKGQSAERSAERHAEKTSRGRDSTQQEPPAPWKSSGLTWLAFSHEGQTKHPHVHVIAYTDQKLKVPDFERLRQHGDRVVERSLVSELRYERTVKYDPSFDRFGPEQSRVQGQSLEQSQGQSQGQTLERNAEQSQGREREVQRELQRQAEAQRQSQEAERQSRERLREQEQSQERSQGKSRSRGLSR
jgi:hypothetical protein